MRAIARIMRLIIYFSLLLTLSGCCCCDPDMLGQLGDGVGEQFGDELEAKMKEQAAMIEAEAAKAQAEAAKMQAEAAEMEAQMKAQPNAEPTEIVIDAKPTAAKPIAAKPTAPAGDLGGSFKDTKFDKANLTGGSIKLDVDGKTKKVSGRFLGQYYRKPFSIPLEGKLAADGSFELKGKHEDSDVVVKGAHTGEALDGKINGKVRGKAIDAKFAAARK